MLGFPGAAVRLVPGSNPPETALAEVYEPPFNNPDAKVQGFSPRGMDIDRNGVVWAALASGHMASFDRRKCKGPLNGPKATGQHCPEGWTLYPEPLPQLKGVTDPGSAGASYYTWVDQFDTFGLGANTPINTGNAAEGLLALKDGQVGRAARAVPARLLHQVDGRPDRRCEGGVEGAGPVVDRQHAGAVPHGNREGHDQQSDPVPDAPGSAGEVSAGVSGSRVPDPDPDPVGSGIDEIALRELGEAIHFCTLPRVIPAQLAGEECGHPRRHCDCRPRVEQQRAGAGATARPPRSGPSPPALPRSLPHR